MCSLTAPSKGNTQTFFVEYVKALLNGDTIPFMVVIGVLIRFVISEDGFEIMIQSDEKPVGFVSSQKAYFRMRSIPF